MSRRLVAQRRNNRGVVIVHSFIVLGLFAKW
jgi:hypothetical protein